VVVADLLKAFEPLPEDCDPRRWVAAAQMVAMTTYGDAYDGSRTRLDERNDPYWEPQDWSCQIEQLQHFIETGERRHSRSINLDYTGYIPK
jgi:hypothetical protein